jgi:hypothetical protein
MFTYPFAVPLSAAPAVWLGGELSGGRGAHSRRAAVLALLGALLGAAILFVPWFLLPMRYTDWIPGELARSFSPAVALLGYLLGYRSLSGPAPYARAGSGQARTSRSAGDPRRRP